MDPDRSPEHEGDAEASKNKGFNPVEGPAIIVLAVIGSHFQVPMALSPTLTPPQTGGRLLKT